jgi:membrane fusion protein (multidrug efflux system)
MNHPFPHTKRPFTVRIFISAVVVFAALWAVISFFKDSSIAKPDKSASKIIHVEATTVTLGSLTQSINAVGNLISNESVEIKTEIDGRVASIAFKDGQEVKAQDPLFVLDDSVQQAELAKAKANMVLATNNVKRAKTLAKSGFTSKVGLEESQAELNLARANVQLAEANLAKTVIRAPFDGVVGIRKVSPGDIVSRQTALVSIDQYSPIKVEFSVPERYLPDIKIHTPIKLRSETQTGRDIPATISAIDSRVGEASRGIRVQAISDNADRALFPGQFVTIHLDFTENVPMPLIPDQALITNANEVFVYLVKDGAVKKQKVTVGSRGNDSAIITDGVKPGDMVVTAGQQKLTDGTKVKVSAPTPVLQTTSPDETRTTLH